MAGGTAMIRLGLLLLLMWVAMLGALKVAASANAVTLTGQSTNTTPAFLKYAWSTPVSGGTLTGITGTLSITSQGYFGEMLASVVVWPQGNCPPQGSEWATYESMSAAYPGSALLAHYILKYGGVGTSTVNVGVSGLSASVAGCVGVLLDGSNFSGSAFTMSANLQLQVGANAKVQTLTGIHAQRGHVCQSGEIQHCCQDSGSVRQSVGCSATVECGSWCMDSHQ